MKPRSSSASSEMFILRNIARSRIHLSVPLHASAECTASEFTDNRETFSDSSLRARQNFAADGTSATYQNFSYLHIRVKSSHVSRSCIDEYFRITVLRARQKTYELFVES